MALTLLLIQVKDIEDNALIHLTFNVDTKESFMVITSENKLKENEVEGTQLALVKIYKETADLYLNIFRYEKLYKDK